MVEAEFLLHFYVFARGAATTGSLTVSQASVMSHMSIQIDSPKPIFGLLSFSLSNGCHGSATMVAASRNPPASIHHWLEFLAIGRSRSSRCLLFADPRRGEKHILTDMQTTKDIRMYVEYVRGGAKS